MPSGQFRSQPATWHRFSDSLDVIIDATHHREVGASGQSSSRRRPRGQRWGLRSPWVSSHASEARRRCWSGRVAAAPELAATRQLVREAKRQPLIEDCDVRPRDCVPMYGRVGACSRSTAQQTAAIAVGLGWAATMASTGRLVSPASTRARPSAGVIAMPRHEEWRLAVAYARSDDPGRGGLGLSTPTEGRADGDRSRRAGRYPARPLPAVTSRSARFCGLRG